jgi:5-phospho-D-xylono-1,4-lactonase
MNTKTRIRKATKPLEKNDFKIIDAHLHIWIKETVEQIDNINIFKKYEQIKNQIINYKKIGGFGLVDCTPYGCGRDGNILGKFIIETKVNIIPTTGFHKKNYYPPDFFIWKLNKEEAKNFFISEIQNCLFECKDTGSHLKAGVIKIPFIGVFDSLYLKLTEAAIKAAIRTGVPIIVHTDQGLNIEDFADYIEKCGMSPKKVMLCHMDKRNEIDLHKSLAQRGYYLEYDTFLRVKYDPEKNLWPLLEEMISMGYDNSIVIGSDIYKDYMWEEVCEKGGLSGFFNSIIKRLEDLKISRNIIKKIVGGNTSDFFNL